ncbi:MAG: enolase C-terminal domain-like protein [Planctomycetota bacterium]|jgi:L-alanine-DL-glutamate epimerase-like enolase superfamily enzyme|nr:enolase C-terminal domain-like protein [Planctomycetota bacterium]
MKIADLQVIPFQIPKRPYSNGQFLPETTAIQTLTKVVTDDGAEGYYFGGHGHGDHDGMTRDQRAAMTGRLKNLVLGHDPFDREKFWHWMWVANIEENLISVLDMVLWDLQARTFGVPVHKLLGGCRERVKAYASTYPNMGSPENYAEHAAACKAKGYRHYKIHPYYFWDPVKKEPAPGRPSHIEQDIELCRAVRSAVGDDMVLSFDPWGTYRNYEEAVRVGRELEKLDFYWFEHPMSEYRVSAYEKLCADLSIPVLSPEIAAGSIYTRADWIRRGASDMSRIDVLRGGITGVKKMVSVCEAYGVKCEIHMSGFANLQILAATSEDTCEYYERGLLAPGVDYDTPQPYLEAICDPLDGDGCVRVPQEPGMGYRINWDYIEENKVRE